VYLPEFLLAAAGLVQRLGESGVRTDVLVAAAARDTEDSVVSRDWDDWNDSADFGHLDEFDDGSAALSELRVPELARHRLSLPAGFGAEREDDLLAAMSELVGFDPEPGVYCLAPDADGPEPGRAAVRAVASRVSKVYQMPLVRFAATPDEATAQLELGTDEWARKCAGLAACATQQVTPLSGRLEYFSL
jgi:hypothetical protein